MARASALSLLLLVAPTSAWANGVMGTDAPSRIPVPAAVHAATVIDLSGTTVELTRVSFNGEVYLYGELGEATVAIPFDKIAEVRVEPTDNPTKRILFAKLRDGSSVSIRVEDDVPCYGETSFGNYKIEVNKLSRILFKAAASE